MGDHGLDGQDFGIDLVAERHTGGWVAIQVKCYQPQQHQREAVTSVCAGLAHQDRGYMVMACGSGKTYAALLIAQQLNGRGGRVLYMVPSLALMSQSIQKWHQQVGDELPLVSLAVCSDARVGKKVSGSDVPYVETFDLVIPLTTDTSNLMRAVTAASGAASLSMMVIFARINPSAPSPPHMSLAFSLARSA